MNIKLLSLIMALFTGIAVSGCNTVDGVGKDVERGGEHIQDASEEVKDRI